MVGAGPNVSRARKLCNKLDDCEECSFYVRVREGLALRVRLINNNQTDRGFGWVREGLAPTAKLIIYKK